MAEADTAIGAVMRSDHPLASRGEVTLSECAAFGAVMFAERWMIEDIMAQEFSRTGAHLHARITSNAMSVIRASVAAGVGIGFVTPVGILGEIRRGEIVHVPVTRVSSQIRTLGLFVRSRTARSRATTLVLDHLASVVTGIGNEVRSLGDAGISPPVRPD